MGGNDEWTRAGVSDGMVLRPAMPGLGKTLKYKWGWCRI
jgi:hypothetical protein